MNTNTDLWDKDISRPWDVLGFPPETVKLLVTCSPIRTLVTDSQGRQAGLDPDTGEIINDIPGAIVTKDGDDPHLIIVPRLLGQYQVQAIGIDQGDYTIGAFEIFSGTTQMTARIFTGTTTVGQSRQFSFDSAVFQEENGQVVLEAEQIGQANRTWISQTTQAGYVGSGYLSAWPDVDQIYTQTFTTTSPRLEYSLNFTTTGTYYVWVRGYASNGAGDLMYVGLDDNVSESLTGFEPREWSWSNKPEDTLNTRVTFEITVVVKY